LFLGHIHDVNVEEISSHFGVGKDYYKKVKTDSVLLASLIENKNKRVFFENSVPHDYIDRSVSLSRFDSFEEAYHQLMHDLVSVGFDSFNLIIPEDDKTKIVYISGGFARNEIFVRIFAAWLPGKKVYTSEIDNSTALGAAMVLWEDAFGEASPEIDLGLKECV
jgi:sugar (pentulose or hexulose) kinase